jgi:hypothetical protein
MNVHLLDVIIMNVSLMNVCLSTVILMNVHLSLFADPPLAAADIERKVTFQKQQVTLHVLIILNAQN